MKKTGNKPVRQFRTDWPWRAKRRLQRLVRPIDDACKHTPHLRPVLEWEWGNAVPWSYTKRPLSLDRHGPRRAVCRLCRMQQATPSRLDVRLAVWCHRSRLCV